MQVGESIIKKFNVKSIVDFGCGIGSFLAGARIAGATKIQGYEYAYESAKPYFAKKMSPYIHFGDAGSPIDCGKFELAMSVEVAEHLLPDQADIFVDNLCNASSKYILLTASPNSGYYHFNFQPYRYWIEKIENKGWTLKEDLRDMLIADWKAIRNIPKHMKRNLMIFTKV